MTVRLIYNCSIKLDSVYQNKRKHQATSWDNSLLQPAYCFRLFLQHIVANYCCNLLLQHIVAAYRYRLLLQCLILNLLIPQLYCVHLLYCNLIYIRFDKKPVVTVESRLVVIEMYLFIPLHYFVVIWTAYFIPLNQ